MQSGKASTEWKQSTRQQSMHRWAKPDITTPSREDWAQFLVGEMVSNMRFVQHAIRFRTEKTSL
jgi:hypothetical protein